MKKYRQIMAADDDYDDIEDYDEEVYKVDEAVSKMSRRYYWETLTELGYALLDEFTENYDGEMPEAQLILYKKDDEYTSKSVWKIAFVFSPDWIIFDMDCSGELATINWYDVESESSMGHGWKEIDDIEYDEDEKY